MDAAFDSAAFAMPLHTVSQPVLSQFGYHLIEITSRKGNKAKGRHILFPIEVAGSHRDQLDAQADSLERLGAERADRAALDTVSRALKLPIGHIGSGAGRHQGPARPAGRSRCGCLGVPGETGRDQPGHRVLHSVLHLPARQPQAGRRSAALAEIRTAVATTRPGEKKIALGRKVADDYVKRLEAGLDFRSCRGLDEAAAQGVRSVHAESIPRSTTLSWSARRSASTWDSGVRSSTPSKGIYVLKVLEHTKADSAQFVKELDQFRPTDDPARPAKIGSGAT